MKAARFLLTAMIVAGSGAAWAPTGYARAQETQQPQPPVRWTLTAWAVRGSAVERGAALMARVHAQIERGWHVYSLYEKPGGPTAMRITLPPGEPYAIRGDFDAPPPRSAMDPAFGMETRFYTGDADVTVPLRAKRKTDGAVAVDVFYQACNREMCLRPTVAHLTASVTEAKGEQP